MAVVTRFGFSDDQLVSRDLVRQGRSRIYTVWLGICVAVICAVILGTIGTILVKGIPAISWEFLSTAPREGMSLGGYGRRSRGRCC